MAEFPYTLRSVSTEEVDLKHLKEIRFQNYMPLNPKFQHLEVNHSGAIKSLEEASLQRNQEVIDSFLQEEQGTLNIIPKKPNVDIKRNLQPKLEKLNKRTQMAIVELLKEKLGKNEPKDEAQMVTQTKVQQSAPMQSVVLPFERTMEALKNFKMNEVDVDEPVGFQDPIQEGADYGNLPDLMEGIRIRDQAGNQEIESDDD
jgi:coiled-coil domain-containing protein 12